MMFLFRPEQPLSPLLVRQRQASRHLVGYRPALATLPLLHALLKNWPRKSPQVNFL
jgi:hypothetical protein